jgi:hypothetical protein
MGSIHLARQDFYPLSDNIEKAFTDSTVLVLEINPDKIDQTSMQAALMENGYYPDDETLRDHVSEETFQLFKHYVEQNKLPLTSFESMRPGLLSLTLSMIEMRKFGFSPELGIDRYFLNKSKHKTVLELETYEQQLKLFFELPAEEWYLKYTLKRMDQMGENLKKITTAWKQGDASTMENIILKDIDSKHPELKPVQEKMFTQRNINMAEKISGYLQTNKTYFVVVGAGHLVGDQGIVSLISKRGYAIEQR